MSNVCRQAMVYGVAACLLFSATPAMADREGRRTAVVDVVEQVGPAVVNITAKTTKTYVRPLDPFGMLGQLEQRKGESLGSGVIIDPQGYVITNYHVISEQTRGPRAVELAVEVIITTQEGEEYQAELVGYEVNWDLAILKIHGNKPFQAVKIAYKEDPMIGETVIAAGNPYGLHNTVTTGVVSALHRSMETPWGTRLTDLIQTDAAINRGNSGGPLLNIDGELIGINTSIISESGGSQGIGFASSARRVQRMYEKYVLNYLGLEARVGLEVIASDLRIARRYGIPEVAGCAVWEVRSGGLGDAAGIVAGDVITQVNGSPCNTPTEYGLLLEQTSSDAKKVELTVVRRATGKTEKIVLRLEDDQARQLTWRGMVIGPLTPRMAEQLRLANSNGVHVRAVQRDSRAYELGVRPDDVIYEINETPIASLNDFTKAIQRVGPRQSVSIRVKRPQLVGGARLYHGII